MAPGRPPHWPTPHCLRKGRVGALAAHLVGTHSPVRSATCLAPNNGHVNSMSFGELMTCSFWWLEIRSRRELFFFCSRHSYEDYPLPLPLDFCGSQSGVRTLSALKVSVRPTLTQSQSESQQLFFFFLRNWQADSKIFMEMQRTKTVPKKDEGGRLTLPSFETYYRCWPPHSPPTSQPT